MIAYRASPAHTAGADGAAYRGVKPFCASEPHLALTASPSGGGWEDAEGEDAEVKNLLGLQAEFQAARLRSLVWH